MGWSLLADAVLLLHALFVAWVVLGGLAVLKAPRLAWLHLPAVAWGVWIEWSGRLCPLTPLEQRLRHAAGERGYSGGFVEHYVTAALYPDGLTRELQWALGAFVLLVNLAMYGLVYARLASRRRRR
jgi:hypothetical protein